MVALVGLGEAGEAVAGPEVERAAVDQHAADRRAVPADELGGGVHDDVGAVLEGADQPRRGHGVVDDERHADVVRHAGHAPDVEEVVAGVADRLAVEGLGVGPGGGPPLVEVVDVGHERHLDAQLGQRVAQQVVGAAVERRRRHDVVAGLGEVEDGVGLGRLARRQRQRPGQADGRVGRPLQRRDPGLHHRLGGVHDAGVDVADLGQREQVRGVLGAAELVRGGLVDRLRPGARRGVGHLPGVHLAGVEVPGARVVGGGVVTHGGEAIRAPRSNPTIWIRFVGSAGHRPGRIRFRNRDRLLAHRVAAPRPRRHDLPARDPRRDRVLRCGRPPFPHRRARRAHHARVPGDARHRPLPAPRATWPSCAPSSTTPRPRPTTASSPSTCSRTPASRRAACSPCARTPARPS